MIHENAGPRVVIVTGSYGSGHDCAARELAREIEADGGLTEIVDVVRLVPAGLGPVLRSVYYAQLRLRPDSWETMLERLQPGRPAYRLTVQALRGVVPALLRAIAGADLVISTHPFASQALGIGREQGSVTVPVVTYLCDSSVHPLWIHPAVDLHLAIHDVAAAEARSWGARTRTVRPVVTPAARLAGGGTDPLAGLGVSRPTALIAGGSLGIGDIERTVEDVLAVPEWSPVVLCGTNERLRRRLSAQERVVALGWRDDVVDIMRRVDCVLNNGGGFTTVEAVVAGTPLVSYRPLPGHGRANAVNLERAGLAPFARDQRQLTAALLAGPTSAAWPEAPTVGQCLPLATPRQLAVT